MRDSHLWLVGSVVHVAAVLAPLGLALVLVAALGWLLRPRSRTTYWRGRPIELTDDSPTLGRRLYAAMFRRQSWLLRERDLEATHAEAALAAIVVVHLAVGH